MRRTTSTISAWLAAVLWSVALLAGTPHGMGNSAVRRLPIRLTALDATERVELHSLISGADTASIACARNETESFQVVVSAPDGRLRGVDAALTDLTNRRGDVIPAESCELFRAVFIPIRTPHPKSDTPPGMWADALAPMTDPYTGESVEPSSEVRFPGRGFDVWQGQSQPLWVDVNVPRDAEPGVYRGALTVTASNGVSAEIPVRVEVWDFALPDSIALHNRFSGFRRAAGYYGLDADSREFRTLEARFIDLMAAHRLAPPLPVHLILPLARDGSIQIDERRDEEITEFVSRYRLKDFEVPRAWFRDLLGDDRARTVAYYRSWSDYLQRKGWTERAYVYLYDEPNDAEAYDRVRRLGELVAEAAPGLRRLIVEQPYPQDSDWGRLDDAVDIWCPLFSFIDEGSVRRVQANGDEVWTYTALVQTTPPYHPDYERAREYGQPPFWQMDFPRQGYRIAPWLCRRYGITGLLYWSTCSWGSPPRNPWDNPTFGRYFNGDGVLVYPGTDAGIEGPVASARLKAVRDGMEDYEYFALLEALGGGQAVEDVVREAVPNWGSWMQDADRLESLRRRLAEEIVRRSE